MSVLDKQCGEVFATFNDITICLSNVHVENDSATKEISVVKNDTDILSVTQDFINIKYTSFSESGNTVTVNTKGGSVTLDLQMFEEQSEDDKDDEKEEKDEKSDDNKKDDEKDDEVVTDEEVEVDEEEEEEE